MSNNSVIVFPKINNFFSGNNMFSGIKESIGGNSLVSKIAFIILIIIIFLITLRLATYFMVWLFSPSKNPILINGRSDAKRMLVYTQDPKLKGSKPILRSENDYQGMQFTWSVWLFIDDIHYKENRYKHVFHKGNDNIQMNAQNKDAINLPSNAPGLYITDNQNQIAVIMNTFNKTTEKIFIDNIPIRKWFNVILRVSNQKTLDIFVNGVLSKRHVFQSPIKQNYGNVYACMNGGFSGHISELRYFSEAIGINSIKNLVYRGPNLAELSGTDLTIINPSYLSTRWYFSGNLDGYNP
tara:strand:- start:1113 stop:2000 length:888 start_codon:yes stop_codon:yes gene_type:complete